MSDLSRPLARKQYAANTTRSSVSTERRIIALERKLILPAKHVPKSLKNQKHKTKLALLIAAHNEELVIGNTIRSAINAGMKPEHIFVVDDNSQDSTIKIARELIPHTNVIKVRRSGKGLALTKAAKKFKLVTRYSWIHIADADGAFSPNYFYVFRDSLRVKNAAATGYIKSLPGRHVSQYRVFEYTVGMEIHRRFQSLFNVIPVIPGPTSCFRSDVFAKVNFANHSFTEDFDVTIQIHRAKMGKIQFIPNAVAYTQDPLTIRDYKKQITRWNRGIMQGVKEYSIGLKFNSIDAYLSYQIITNLLFFANYCVWLPYLVISRGSFVYIASTFVFDVLLNFGIMIAVAAKTKRWDIVSAFPHMYMIRWISLGVFLKAFVEVGILGRHGENKRGWTSTQRYAPVV